MIKKYFSYSVLLICLFIFGILLTTSCKKKGEVTIFDVVDSVENCSVPYVVYFYPDFTTQTNNYNLVWDFGDGTTSQEKFPVHIYQKTGQFRASLTISELEAKQSRTIMVDLQQESLPILPNFVMSSASNNYYVPATVYFDNTSLHSIEYLWEFGDGDVSSKKSTVHTFTTPGNYAIKMNAICNGDTGAVTQSITVNPPPQKIIVEGITIWLPDNYLGKDITTECYYSIHQEFVTYNQNTNTFPMSWNLSEGLFFFSGDYNTTKISFEVWDANDIHNPIYTFDVPTSKLQDDGYPETLNWDNGNFAAKVNIKYLAN